MPRSPTNVATPHATSTARHVNATQCRRVRSRPCSGRSDSAPSGPRSSGTRPSGTGLSMSWARPTASAGPRTLPGHEGSAGRSEGGRLLEFVDRGACGPVAGRLRCRRRARRATRRQRAPEPAGVAVLVPWSAQHRPRPEGRRRRRRGPLARGACGRRDRDVAPGRRRTRWASATTISRRRTRASCISRSPASGATTPCRSLKCYEPIVMAKIGGLNGFSNLSRRDGPSFVATPYCLVHRQPARLAGCARRALRARSRAASARGSTPPSCRESLAHDTWNWIMRLLTSQYPGALELPRLPSTANG